MKKHPLQILIQLYLIITLFQVTQCEIYSVLVAGSKGYENYRHQADICHSYHVLRENGVPAENIIVMLYNDAANAKENPFPGTLFNKYSGKNSGKNYYDGCIIDYEGDDVTVANYLAVITGNKNQVTGGNGRVLNSTKDDHVFMFYSDHGSPGKLAFPVNKEHLYADQLLAAFNVMFQNKMYKQMTYYLEACESGSMFIELNPYINIYAASAANPEQPSYERYCPPFFDVVDGEHLKTCLGDEFSVSWMENADNFNTNSESLQSQFEVIHKLTIRSNAMQWGSLEFQQESIGTFEGDRYQQSKPKSGDLDQQIIKEYKYLTDEQLGVRNSRLARIEHLKQKYEDKPNSINTKQLMQELEKNELFTRLFAEFQQNYGLKDEQYDVYRSTNFECYRFIDNKIQDQCGYYNDKALELSRYVYQFCQKDNIIPEIYQWVEINC